MIETANRQKLRVGIIGGGPGGLMTAYLLEQRLASLCDITIFEAGHRLGGKIMTRQFEAAAVRYEAGTAELYDYSHVGRDPLRELIAELGLGTRPLTGQSVVMNDLILKSDADILHGLGEKSWKALRQFDREARSIISPVEYYESDWNAQSADPLLAETFRTFLSRISDESARRYIEVLLHSDVATEPEHTSAMYGLQNYLMNDSDYMRLYTIVGGIERLPEKLSQRLTARILLRQPVVRVEQTLNHGYRVFSRYQGNVVSEDFDFVVVALPVNWILNIDWAGGLGNIMRRHHAYYDHLAHYLRVSVLFQKPFWREQIAESYFMLDAFGGCCVYDESSRDESNSHGTLGWLLAGEAALTMSNFSDDALIELVLESLPSALNYRREWFLEGHVNRWVGTVNALPGGYPALDPDSRHLPDPQEHPRLLLVGDYLFDSTLNGLLDSADVVSEWIVEIFESPVEAGATASDVSVLAEQAA
jgi:monoamine oxidase